MRIFQYISIFAFFLIIVFAIHKNSTHFQTIKGNAFGTYYNIKIRTDKKNISKSKIDDLLNQIDKQMSVFNPQSEISALNELPANKKTTLSDDLSYVIRSSHEIWKLTDGYFDPTLGNLINLWGFGNQKSVLPTNQQITKALQTVGMNKLRFHKKYKEIIKSQKSTTINLSAIAKGYAVDKIGELLNKEGLNDYIIDIGGEIKTSGFRSQKGDYWNVAINKPEKNSNENIMILSLSNISVATSGNYRNYYTKDGKTYAHTISHKTGYPIENDILSVSVFHDSCMYADAYATAINSMGVNKGIKFAEKNNLKAIIFDKNMQAIYTKSAKDMME